MKRVLFVILAVFAIQAAAIAQTLAVPYQWDASADGPGPVNNPVKYKLCTSAVDPISWPSGSFPADRVCIDAGIVLQQTLQMAVGIKFVFATAYNLGLSVDGTPNPAVVQESGPSNILKVEIFAPPGRPDKLRVKSVQQVMDSTTGQFMKMTKRSG
jgi:hypothetical protein